MTVNFNDYKETHKSGDQRELERREAVLDQACDDLEHFSNQELLKWKNKPKGTVASEEEVDEIFMMMGRVGQASRDFKSQQRKMGLRPWENEAEGQASNKVVSFKA